MRHYFTVVSYNNHTDITFSLHNIKPFIAEDEASTDSGDTVDDDNEALSDWDDHGRYWRRVALYRQGSQVGRYRTNPDAKTDHRVQVRFMIFCNFISVYLNLINQSIDIDLHYFPYLDTNPFLLLPIHW